jgi:flagellar hook-basal body complex protein FliE
MSYGVLTLTVQTQNYWLGVMPLMAISAFGMALLVSPLSTAVMTSVDDDDTGTASGINNAVSRMAGLVAVAAMGLLAAALYPVLMGGGETSFGEIVENAAPSVARAHADATTLTFAAIAGVTAVLSAVSAAIAWTTLPRSGKADAG